MLPQSFATFLAVVVALFSATATRAEKQVTITRLVMRDSIVTIASNPSEVLYSVKTRDGRVINANLTEAQLEAQHPELYQQVRPAIAKPNTNAKKGEILWFGLSASERGTK
jgi:hypothetical protein